MILDDDFFIHKFLRVQMLYEQSNTCIYFNILLRREEQKVWKIKIKSCL